MLQSIEAIIEKDGSVRLLEPVHPKQAMKVIVTLLEPVVVQNREVIQAGHVSQTLALLNSSIFQNIPPRKYQ